MNAVPPRSLLFEERESRLAALDQLARPLWLGALIHSQGSLEPRLQALAALREQLHAGQALAPECWSWPPPPLAGELASVLAGLGLDRYCAGEPELTDTVLLSILFHLDAIVDYRDRGAGEEQARRIALEALAADWRERCGEIDELIEVFGKLPDDAMHERWGLLRGVLHSSGWQQVLRVHRLLGRLGELAKVIRRLGRARDSEQPDRAGREAPGAPEQASLARPARRLARVPDAPGQTRGIQRSDRVARMLPAEAMLLNHPCLRLVWHARRAERALLCYEDDDLLPEVRLARAPAPQPSRRLQPERKRERGPILVCVDTSGSMRGGAESVAKAVVLEAMRAAHAQRRACAVFAFGGPEELIELELRVDAGGIQRATEFLGQAFGGGTDLCAPLERVIAKMEEQRWQQADLLIASDGEFGAPAPLVARLDAIKRECGLRVQGVLIGDRETIGLLEIADDIFHVRDWRSFGDVPAATPTHSPHLTSEYFPGALRNADTRAATVSGDRAAHMVRTGKHQGAASVADTPRDPPG